MRLHNASADDASPCCHGYAGIRARRKIGRCFNGAAVLESCRAQSEGAAEVIVCRRVDEPSNRLCKDASLADPRDAVALETKLSRHDFTPASSGRRLHLPASSASTTSRHLNPSTRLLLVLLVLLLLFHGKSMLLKEFV
ncbi:unnamed protein product [Protopolystoma xenopodis]|uniref:Uncharacterized protein n=1 Tax=Protopolystoma xenopodis TaxID=117903 RepID=A0A448XCM4_9PLAT|nr:unnamed protein product [Protopolystoma xenopodis]